MTITLESGIDNTTADESNPPNPISSSLNSPPHYRIIAWLNIAADKFKSPEPVSPSELTLLRRRIGAWFNINPSKSIIGNDLLASGLVTGIITLDLDGDKVKEAKELAIEAPSGVDLTHAKVVLRNLSYLGDGMVSVPGLKYAVNIALEIVNVVETADSNRESCYILGNQVFRLVQCVNDRITSDPTLNQHIGSLERDLKDILRYIKIVAARNVLNKAFHAESDRSMIAKCEKLVDRSTTLFIVKLQLDHSYLLKDLHTRLLPEGGESSKGPQAEAGSAEEDESTDEEAESPTKRKAAKSSTRRRTKTSKSSPSHPDKPQTSEDDFALKLPIGNDLTPAFGINLASVVSDAASRAGIVNIGCGNIIGNSFNNTTITNQSTTKGATTLPQAPYAHRA